MGADTAQGLLDDGVIISRVWPGSDPRRNLRQYRRVHHKDSLINQTTEAQELQESDVQVSSEAAKQWESNANAFAAIGASGAPASSNQKKNKDKSPKDKGPESACIDAVRKALTALDAKVAASKSLVAAAAGVKYTAPLAEEPYCKLRDTYHCIT